MILREKEENNVAPFVLPNSSVHVERSIINVQIIANAVHIIPPEKYLTMCKCAHKNVITAVKKNKCIHIVLVNNKCLY